MEKSKESVSRGAERILIREHQGLTKTTQPIFQIKRVYMAT
nr:palindromic element RPE5 domain-containing protein [Rickettsia tillamookensis]